MQNISNYIPSKTIRVLIYALGTILALCIVFELGVQFGAEHPTRFAFRGVHVPPPFGLPHEMMPPGAPGFVGKVTDATLPEIAAQTRDGDTVHITISSTTKIRAERGRDATTTNNTPPTLTTGDMIIVIGEPSTLASSTIDARFIRILPPPPKPAVSF